VYAVRQPVRPATVIISVVLSASVTAYGPVLGIGAGKREGKLLNLGRE
jgi:hypothetical protein